MVKYHSYSLRIFMKRITKSIKKQKIIIIIMVMTLLFSLFFHQYLMKDYSRINNSTTDFVSAKVMQVISSDIEYDESLDIDLGYQKVKLIILEGESKGQEVVLDNYLTVNHNINVSRGEYVVMSKDAPKGIDAYYTIYQYDRGLGMIISMFVLFIILIVIGKGKGIKSIIGLGYTLFITVFLLLPMIFSGYPPVPLTVLVIILSTIVSLLLLNGQSQKTYSAILATISGVMISAVCFYVVSYFLHINGFSSDEAESLVLINQATGLCIKDVLFAGVLISSLGAIMDVGMSIVSALFEIYHHKSDISLKELFYSGIEIGKDMIGTMTNTLILAFTGNAFVSLLVFISFQVDVKQLLYSNFIVIEFAQGIAGTLGIILTVPIASFIVSYLIKKYQYK